LDLELLEEMTLWVLLDLEHLEVMKKDQLDLYYLWVLEHLDHQRVLLNQ
jgi:hypothetical protein